MTKEEIENEAGRLIEILSTGQDPLDVAIGTLTRLWGDPQAFLAWMSVFVARNGPERFPEFHARVVKTTAFRAMNVLLRMSQDPTIPPTDAEPTVRVSRTLLVSLLHLTPDNRTTLVRDAVLFRTQRPMEYGMNRFETGDAVLWTRGQDSGSWSIEPDENAREMARQQGLPDIVPIFAMAKSLDCRTITFCYQCKLTRGLPTWLPGPGESWLSRT